MATTANKKVIHRVLEETRFAYRIMAEKDHVETDYAEFAACQAIADFRRAFGDPELTCEQLSQILRCASNKERRRQCKTPWAMFMTNYLERNDNSQSTHIKH